MTKYSQLSLAINLGVGLYYKIWFHACSSDIKAKVVGCHRLACYQYRLIKIYIDEAQVVLMSSRLEFTSNLESLANILASFVLNPVDKIIIDKLLM
jgi:predicted DNA-binding protein with PD1-like motif